MAASARTDVGAPLYDPRVYAVIDVETTGLRPNWHDRIVEIAVVQLDALGRVESEWCSLVNPGRDLGPQHIHGISAADARRAPGFDEFAGEIAQQLRGRVVVGHNVGFDLQFLIAEYERLGAPVRATDASGLCTMRLAARFLPTAGRSLADCCRWAGIELDNAHSALYDARASGELLAFILDMTGGRPAWSVTRPDDDWPALPITGAPAVGRRGPADVSEHFLARLVDRLPRTHRPEADAYLEVLDRALLDRYISVDESDALVTAAERLRLGRADVVELHRTYLSQLAAVAAADGAVSDAERADLTTVATLLGLDGVHVDDVLRAARDGTVTVPRQARPWLEPGDVVVFTGQTAEPRELWERRAVDAGLSVADAVTRHTRLVVAADPDTLSGKARRAAAYGIPVVHPVAFTAMLPRPRPGDVTG
jgi:DNA polymerase-3 subunit epsilon